MADNRVQVTIDGEDNADGAFAKATAEAKSFEATIRQAGRTEVKAHTASAEAIGAHSRALALLRDAEEVLGHETENVGTETDRTTGIFGRLRSAVTGLVTGALSGLGQSVGQLPGAFAEMAANAAPNAVIFGAVALAAGALLAVLTPLIASLGLVAAGFGAFAVVAAPEVLKVFKALTEHGKQLHQTLKGMSPAERDLVKSTQPLKDEFQRLQKAIQPYVVKAFAEGIRILKGLFPALKPLVEAAGKALDQFLKSIAQWINGPSGQKFIAWMRSEGPQAIATFGKALFTGMRWLGQFADFLFNTGETISHNWFRYMHDISNATDAVREAFVSAGHTIEAIWNAIAGAAQSAASVIVGAISRISGALAGLPGMGILGTIGQFAGKLFADGGIVGAASGGVRGGFQLVGERGPELVRLPTGSTVYSAGQTQGMLGGAGGFNGPLEVTLRLDGTGSDSVVTAALLEILRKAARTRAGGNVQSLLGRPA